MSSDRVTAALVAARLAGRRGFLEDCPDCGEPLYFMTVEAGYIGTCVRTYNANANEPGVSDTPYELRCKACGFSLPEREGLL